VSGGFLSKLARALSILGISSPEDIRARERQNVLRVQPRPSAKANAESGSPSDAPQTGLQNKEQPRL